MEVQMGQTDDVVAILQLQAAYADILSRRALSELGRLFLPDAPIVLELPRRTHEVTGPQAFAEFVDRRIGGLAFFQFVVLNTVIDLEEGPDPQLATGRMHMCELNQDAVGSRMTVLFGLYQDGYTKVDNRWWFGRRRFAPLAFADGQLEVFGYPVLDV
jgi:hypothetical protein